MAIAFDAAATGSSSSSATLTYSHTCASGAILDITAYSQVVGGAVPTSVTYAGSACTKIVDQANSNPNLTSSRWYHASPSSGANNIVITYGASQINIIATSISLTGCATSPLGNFNNTNGASTTPSVSLTTGTANSVIISSIGNGNYPESLTVTGTNQTQRADVSIPADHELMGSTQTTTTAGSYTQSWSKSAASQWAAISAEYKPLVATGPTNVKTYDGVTMQ